LQKLPHTKVYKKEDVPDKLNFKRNNRIAPLVAITDEGYALHCCTVPADPLPGNHGFVNELHSMRAVFLGEIFVHSVIYSPQTPSQKTLGIYFYSDAVYLNLATFKTIILKLFLDEYF
jgi:hypothetical protein